MKKLIDLNDLLVHEILNLFSAEEQIIEGLPVMIEKTSGPLLKEAFTQHLAVTIRQKERLEKIKTVLTGEKKTDTLWSIFFGTGSPVKCRGLEGLINEAEKILLEHMTSRIKDAALIGVAQKIEHYEITGYGTALAFARQLNMDFIAGELKTTLEEEYDADQTLIKLAFQDNNPYIIK